LDWFGWATHNNLAEVPHEKVKLCKHPQRFTLWSTLVIIYDAECKLLGSCIRLITQNHRMVGVGRDLWGSPSPTPCPSRVAYSRLQRTLSRRVLNISREGDSTASLGSLFQCSVN